MLIRIYLYHHLPIIAFRLLVEGDVLWLAVAEGIHCDSNNAFHGFLSSSSPIGLFAREDIVSTGGPLMCLGTG